MEDDIGPIITNYFEDCVEVDQKPIFSCISHPVECDSMNCNGVSEKRVDLLLSLLMSKSNVESNIELEIVNTLKQTSFCETCRKNLEPKITLSECIVLNIAIIDELNDNVLENQENVEMTELEKLQNEQIRTLVNINDIQKRIVFDGVSYVLKVVVDHPGGDHFKSYFRIKDRDFLEMDDLIHQRKEIVKKNLSTEVNLKLLIYVKSKKKFPNQKF
jgi:hypothetical protein